jgi:hypothetical protein
MVETVSCVVVFVVVVVVAAADGFVAPSVPSLLQDGFQRVSM